MAYAEIAVNTKTQKIDQTFTYLIPPALLTDTRPGILVEVPFRGRKIKGVILEIKRYADRKIKGKIRSISKILDPSPVLDPARLELAKWISGYYLAPIGETVFTIFPPVAHRLLHKQQISEFFAIAKNSDKQHVPKIYTLYDRIDSRLKDYIKLTKKVIEKNKQVIILFPEIAGKESLFKRLGEEFGTKNITYLHGGLSKTERHQNWLDIRSGKKKIIIGSRSAIFAPCSNLGLVIIDAPENFGYKEEQSPRYHTVAVAKKLSQISNSHLILGSLFPSVENLYHERKGEYQVLKKCQMSNVKCQIAIVDSNQDRGILSWRMEQAIGETLKRKGRVLLFANRRGEGSNLVCFDCGYIFHCPRCEIPLVPSSEKISNLKSQISNLVCHKCNHQSPIPATCPKCQGVKLKTTGIGTGWVEKEIKRIFPQAKTLIIEKDRQRTTHSEQRIANVIIGTKKILDYPEIEADLAGMIGIDNVLNLPDFRSSENTLSTIVGFISNTSKELIIQTFNPANETIRFIADKQFNQFLKNELEKRRQAGYPPFSQLVKLVYQDKDESRCQKETERMLEKLKLEIRNSKFEIELMGPGPCFIAKKRDRYRYQIIVKTKDQRPKTKNFLSNLELPKGWAIDTDPIDLL